MKPILTIVAAIAFLVIAQSTRSNPILLSPCNELQIDGGSNWILEMYASDPVGTLDGCHIRTNSGTAIFKNGIHLGGGSGYLLITQDSLLGPLTIDPLGDSLVILSPGGSFMGRLTFGDCPSSMICSPGPGQSICWRGFDIYYLDNSPTLGSHNDTTNAMGTIAGIVTDSLGRPIPQVLVSNTCWPNLAYSDSSGRFELQVLACRCSATFSHANCTARNVSVQAWPESTITVNVSLDCLAAVSEQPGLRPDFRLLQNYPNPFNPATTFSFTLSHRSFVTLKVFDIFGREVATVVDEARNAGTYEAQWDASNVASGVYFYRLIADGFVQTRKMVLMR